MPRGTAGERNSIKPRTILLVGILVREAFSFWTGHPFDFEIWVRVGYWVARGYTPYDATPVAPGLTFSNIFTGTNHAAIGYLPFWPLILAGIYLLFTVVGFGNPFVYYFMVKQPMILGDVILGYLLYSYVRQRKPGAAQKVLVLWLFSPLPLIVSSIWGMFDSLTMMFVMLALVAPAGRARAAWSGVATFLKSIPILFILPITYSREKRVLNCFIALVIPVILSVVIVYLEGWPWLPSVTEEYSVLTTLANTLQVSGFPLSLWATWFYLNYLGIVPDSTFYGVESWGGYLWIPAVVIASLLARRWFRFDTDRGVVQSMLVIYLTFLLVRGQVNEQYSIYLLGLLLIDVALWSPRRMKFFYLVTLVIMVDLVANNILLVRFLAPAFPDIQTFEQHLIQESGPWRFGFQYAAGLAFSALNIWYLATLVRERSKYSGFETAATF